MECLSVSYVLSYIFIAIIFIIVVIWIFIIFIFVLLLFFVELFNSGLRAQPLLVLFLTYSLQSTCVTVTSIFLILLVNGSWLLVAVHAPIVVSGSSENALHEFLVLGDLIQGLRESLD